MLTLKPRNLNDTQLYDFHCLWCKVQYMRYTPTYFAGPICFNPNTESETFVWYAILGGLTFTVLSLILGIAVLIVKIRKTSGPTRASLLRGYGFSVLVFFLLASFGWSTGNKMSDTDVCRSAIPSIHGTIIGFLMLLTVFTSILFTLAYMLPENKISKLRSNR